MVQSRTDVLELLLPGASGELQRRALGLTTFARLLVADAQGVRSPSVAVTLDHAAREFERDGAERCRAVLRELLRAHVAVALRASSFLWVGEPSHDVPELWRLLAGFGVQGAHPPLPDERALAVAERLLALAARAGFDEDELALWRARRLWAAEGARRAEAEIEAGFERSASLPGARRAAWLAHRVECALERGAPRRARAWLDQHAAWLGLDPRLAQLDQWARVALGETLRRVLVWTGALPAAIVEWRDADAGARPFLAGREPRAPDRGEASATQRLDLGASVLHVVAVGAGGVQRTLFHDLAAGLRARFAAWVDERDGATRIGGAPERRVVATARRLVLRRVEGDDLRAALDREGCEVLVVEPVLDRRGEVAGWLWLEFEHRLIPSGVDLAAAAQGWRTPVLDALDALDSAQQRASDSRGIRARAAIADAPGERAEAIRRQTFETLVDGLEMKTAQRHWWGFVLEGERLACVASGGAELASGGSCGSARELGAARILQRALRTRGWVEFDEPSPDLSVHPGAASGVALALERGERVRMVLAIESSRRRDFRPADLERWGERARSRAADFAAAEFRAWHRRRFGCDLWLDSGERLDRRFDEVLAAARCRAPVAVVGPAGAGKTVLARWLHFERPGADPRGPVIGFEAPAGAAAPGAPAAAGVPARPIRRGPARPAPAAAAATSIGRAAAGAPAALEPMDLDPSETWLLARADALSPAQQGELLRALAGSAAGAPTPRIVVTLLESPAALAARGAWSRELADAFGHLELRVAPLAERRTEVPGLLASLLARFAEREQRSVPRLADDALALLWRREWRRNLRELEAVAYRLVIGQAARELDAEWLAGELARMGLDAPRKLPSRQAGPVWIAQALETTRHASGGVNKTRAAAYLGWDPDTLVTRMRALGIDDSGSPAVPPP